MKLHGTIFTDTLSWDDNCSNLVKKVNGMMQLLRKVWSFGSSQSEIVDLWKTFCRSVLEQTCVLWDGGLTVQNKKDLDRTQKSLAKLILEENYSTYSEALKILNLDSLEERRKKLTLRFIKTSLADGKFKDLFPKKKKKNTT